jgi:hypothetical protein
LLILSVSFVFGALSYTGYSGALGSLGTCASSCHGSGSGTIVVSGFPTSYVPGQTYTIKVSRTSGSKIGNFNASIRDAANNRRAGTITALYRTSTYNVAAESNGVHLSSSSQDSGKFTWTAPTSGAAVVKLYLAGTQGTSQSAPNTTIALTSALAQGQEELTENSISNLSIQTEPSIINGSLVMRISMPDKKTGSLKILQANGRIIETITVTPGTNQTVIWAAVDKDGKRLCNGTYFASLFCENRQIIKKFIITNN